MRAELGNALDAGALGFSFTQSSSHSDGDGQPVASRWATPEELIAMARRSAATRAPRSRASCRAASTSSPTTRSSCSRTVSAAANRPLNWNVLTVDAREPERVPAPALGAATAPRSSAAGSSRSPCRCRCPMNMSFLNFCGIWLHPRLEDIADACRCPSASRACATPRSACRCSSGRSRREAGVFRRLADFGDYRLGDIYAPANEGLKGRIVRDIAAERGQSDFAHAARHRDRRRAAHRAVAHPPGRRRRVVGPAHARCGTTRGR